jgi:hypothetical protein
VLVLLEAPARRLTLRQPFQQPAEVLAPHRMITAPAISGEPTRGPHHQRRFDEIRFARERAPKVNNR